MNLSNTTFLTSASPELTSSRFRTSSHTSAKGSSRVRHRGPAVNSLGTLPNR
jgi:hypothetical protein